MKPENVMTNPSNQEQASMARPSSVTAASYILWLIAAALLVTSIAKFALTGDFWRSADAARVAVPIVPDGSIPNEQGFLLLYLIVTHILTALAYALFAWCYASAARRVGRGSDEARRFTITGSVFAIIVVGIAALILNFMSAVSNDADTLYIDYIREATPTWFALTELLAQALVVVASILAIALLFTPRATDYFLRDV